MTLSLPRPDWLALFEYLAESTNIKLDKLLTN